MLRSSVMSQMLADSEFRFKPLQEIEARVPWQELSELLKTDFMESNIGRGIVNVETMLRIYFLQLRYNMPAPDIEEALFHIEILREFAQIDMKKGIIPSETCINHFNKLIKSNKFESQIINAFNLDSTEENKR